MCAFYQVHKYVPDAVVANAVGAEVAIKLPKESVSKFSGLLEELESPEAREFHGIGGFGLSITTIEEV